jgi:hypothetical protein
MAAELSGYAAQSHYFLERRLKDSLFRFIFLKQPSTTFGQVRRPDRADASSQSGAGSSSLRPLRDFCELEGIDRLCECAHRDDSASNDNES